MWWHRLDHIHTDIALLNNDSFEMYNWATHCSLVTKKAFKYITIHEFNPVVAHPMISIGNLKVVIFAQSAISAGMYLFRLFKRTNRALFSHSTVHFGFSVMFDYWFRSGLTDGFSCPYFCEVLKLILQAFRALFWKLKGVSVLFTPWD